MVLASALQIPRNGSSPFCVIYWRNVPVLAVLQVWSEVGGVKSFLNVMALIGALALSAGIVHATWVGSAHNGLLAFGAVMMSLAVILDQVNDLLRDWK